MGCCSCWTRCCVCAVFTQVVAILCMLAVIPVSYLSYEYYLKPWGEEQLAKVASHNIVAGISCADCAGVNLEFPVSSSSSAAGVSSSYSEFEVYLINNGGKFVSALASVGVAVGSSSLLVSLVATIAVSSSSSSSSSNGSLVFEALLLINQGQFITLLGSLNLHGAPRFFYEFCKKFAWTNLQFFPNETLSVVTRTLLAADTNNGEASTAKGVQRYAQLVGVNMDHLFYYTCLAVAAACAVIAVLYFILRCGVQLCKKEHKALTNHLGNRAIRAMILLLLVLQYILAMTSSFQIYYSITARRATGELVLAFFVLICSCVGFVAFGMLKISRYSHELEDLGTEAHEKKPFNHKYGAYYEDFTRENRYFFVAKIGLEILSGCVVGIVQDPMYQIGSLVALNAAFLVLVIARDPYLVRLFFYVCIVSGYLRVTLLLFSIIQSSPDIFPQSTRNFVAELTIGLNALLFMCLLMRQIYTMTRALYRWCQSSDASSSHSFSFSESSRDASWRSSSRSDSRNDSRSDSRNSSSRAKQGKKKQKKGKDEYEARFTLQQLIASKIREDPPPVTPPMHGTPPSREPYQGNPSDRFV